MESLGSCLSPEDVGKISISFHVFPGEPEVPERDGIDLRFYPDLALRNSAQKQGLLIKRGIDFLGSLIGLVVFSPVFCVLAGLVKLTSRGPVFFRQERVGQFGKPFVFLKFRSMFANNDPSIHKAYVAGLIESGKDQKKTGEGAPKVFKIQNDPR